MIKKTAIVVAVSALFLAGCSTTNDYRLYAQSQRAIAEANSKASIAKIDALKEIANSGDTTARVAAVMALQQATSEKPSTVINAPASSGDTALKWASVLMPSLTQFYAIGKSTDVAIVNSNNNKDIAINNNEMVVDLVKGRKEPIIGTSDDVLLYPQ